MSDDAKVQAAVIGCLSAVLVAVMSLVAGVVAALNASRTARSVEALKRSSDEARKRQVIDDGQLKKALDALRQALVAIQFYKDRVQLVLAERSTPLDTESAMEMLIGGRERLLETYESGHPDLTEEEADELHGAKDISVLVTNRSCDFLRGQSHVANLSSQLHMLLSSARADLSDIQLRLRESMNQRLMMRMFK